jgi:membrane associated rhomboid family serine protease
MMKEKLLKLFDPGLVLLILLMAIGFVLTNVSTGDQILSTALTLPELMYRSLILNDKVFDGQLWRLATYACIHKSLGYLATGMGALTFFYLKARQYARPTQLVVVFALAVIFGGAMQIYSNWLAPVIGASAGWFGLWGLWVGLAFKTSKPMFNRRTIRLLCLSVVAQYALAILSPGSATVAHNAGFLLGAFLGIAMPFRMKVPELFSKLVRKTAQKCA